MAGTHRRTNGGQRTGDSQAVAIVKIVTTLTVGAVKIICEFARGAHHDWWWPIF